MRDGVARTRVVVLISGRGSNMVSLVEAAEASQAYAVVLVASDKPDAPGLALARAAGVPTFALSPNGIGKAAFEAELDAALRAAGIELIALAGYMRLLSPAFVARWRGRIVNIHPSLLPAYKGLDTHARALAAGEAVAGCSVHLVTEELDAGRVLGRAEVPVLPGDTPDTLAARVLVEEHRLYPRVLADYVRAMTDLLARVRETALALPGTEERNDGFYIAGEPFVRPLASTLSVRDSDGWVDIDLSGDVNWSDVDESIARSWELTAPRRLLEAGGR